MPPLVKKAMLYFLFSVLSCHLLCSGAPWRLFLLSIMAVAVRSLNCMTEQFKAEGHVRSRQSKVW